MVWCSGSPISHTLTYHTILIVVGGGLVWSGSPIPVNPCQSVGWPVARRNSTNAQHSPHFDSLISHCEKYSKSLLVSGKSQKETARHTSTLPYKEEEIFGEFHISLLSYFIHFISSGKLLWLFFVINLIHILSHFFVCIFVFCGGHFVFYLGLVVYIPPPLLQGPNIWAVEWIIH